MGQKLFRTREIPQSGSKAKDGDKKKEEERAKVGDNNGQAMHGARKLPGPMHFPPEVAQLKISFLQT